jgi:predicted acyltransferase
MTKRVISLDVFRGITVAAMIFVNTLPHTLYTPTFLEHSPWVGLTFVDLVFPFFVFIVGVSMAYSFKSRSNQSRTQLWGHFLYRVVALFTIGLFLNWIGGGLPLRIPGVLQLIALSSLFAAPLAFSKPKWIILAAAIIMTFQSLILMFVSAPGVTAGSFQEYGNIAGWIDVNVFGSQHLYGPNFDPEGILSILTGVSMVLLGLFVGKTLQIRGGNWNTMKILLAGGLGTIIIGLIISIWVPVIKQLWTASFVLITAGLATIILALLYSYLDILNRKSILKIAIPLGLNALILYVLSAVVNTLLEKIYVKTSNGSIELFTLLYQGAMSFLGPNGGTVFYTMIIVVFWGIIAVIMRRRNIYIKL